MGVISKFQRGAIPTSRARLAAARPHVKQRADTPADWLWFTKYLSMWGNAVFGDCVTAEEAFALATQVPDVIVGYHKAVKWARRNWALNGAGIWEILTQRQSDPFYIGQTKYFDGGFVSVDWTNPAALRDAIYSGPVKLGVSADSLQNVPGIGEMNGWFATGLTPGPQDHCTSLCGFGSFSYLAAKLGMPAAHQLGTPRSGVYYAMFTWSTVGIIDWASLQTITGEAWLRTPTTIMK